MGNFTRHDLQRHYYWTTSPGDSKLRGEPDSSLLNRQEGYEVLYMINRLMDSRGVTSVSSGQKIERMIHATPSHLRSQEHVKSWINANWDKHRLITQRAG